MVWGKDGVIFSYDLLRRRMIWFLWLKFFYIVLVFFVLVWLCVYLMNFFFCDCWNYFFCVLNYSWMDGLLCIERIFGRFDIVDCMDLWNNFLMGLLSCIWGLVLIMVGGNVGVGSWRLLCWWSFKIIYKCFNSCFCFCIFWYFLCDWVLIIIFYKR